MSNEEGLGSKFKDMLTMWRRILKLSRKPDNDEFKLLLKLNLLGFTLVGSIAYVIHIMVSVVLPAIGG
ncbi:MAG: protein translocase SEC61 complex subunit gamma [Desulfurococcales archaeon]|jgi:protein transport protein SEC61 subunit gamma-like protein|nr:protein translocase SEC61 complex subunit gamma [Thermoprotei archaeon]NAY89490.1 protein translocase SEC61 complex subunit gamma [Desulfurococcales archaeon]